MRYLATLAGLVLTAAQGVAIARWNGDPLQNNNPPARNVEMPEGIRNSVVRVRTSYAVQGVETLTLGSGVVLRAMRDEGADTGWLCVLTSAHETLFPDGVFLRRHAIGFGNGGERDFPLFSRQNRFFPFPRQGNENRVDLAILGIRVTDWNTQVPRVLTPPTIAGEMRGDVVHAAYGATGRVDVENREYIITRDPFGTFRSGTNIVDSVVDHTTGIHQRTGERFSYRALQSDMDFRLDGKGRPIAADSHSLNGDSGGPTFQVQDRQWRLVGIMGESEQTARGTIIEGADMWDVRVATYEEWITATCNAVPEPGTLVVLVGGVGALLFRRGSRAR
ncbi:MAG: PEP-CTERM sorting domain-containing protein [Armatimonadota bacterium]